MAHHDDQNQDELNYDTQKSYKELLYGKYIFLGKLVAVAAILIAAIFLLLNKIGKSMKEVNVQITISDYLALNETERIAYRNKVKNMLIGEVLEFRIDTVLVVVDNDKYVFSEDRGVYSFPEERHIYGCRLHALEMVIKRSLLEMEYPFLFTRLVKKDSLDRIDLSRYRLVESAFPLYITKAIDSIYTIPDRNTKDATRKVHLPDSISLFFSNLYAVHDADLLFEKYVGDGPVIPFQDISIQAFEKLPPDSQKAIRRAFLSYDESTQKKIRKIRIPVSSSFDCQPVNEKPTGGFNSITQQKLHELEVGSLLTRYFNHATFSLVYPMVYAYNITYEEEAGMTNNVRLVALKGGMAPAHFNLDRGDCPMALKQGMYADITDLIVNWDQFKYFPKIAMKETSLNGRFFGIPKKSIDIDCIAYRRDWLEEPGIIEWFQQKGWIHPKDHRPYIPFDWNYDDFKTICKLITDNDKTGKRKGAVELPGPLLYLESYGMSANFTFAMDIFFKVNPSGKTTWEFFDDNPIFIEGLKTVHDIYWIDKSIRTGVDVNYSMTNQEFNGSRAGMYQTTAASGIVANALSQKYTIFGNDRPYDQIVGMTSLPGRKNLPPLNIADCSMCGLNPYMDHAELTAAVAWLKVNYSGESIRNNIRYQAEEAAILNTSSKVYREALASTYLIDFNEFGINIDTLFPPIYIEFFDHLRKTQFFPAPPSMEDFGLKMPPLRMVQAHIFTMFEKVLVNSEPDYNTIIQETRNIVNTSALAYKDDNSKEKLRLYTQALENYIKTYMPQFYEYRKVRFQQDFQTIQQLPN